MSLSQKHSGLILVPWFNIAEWNSVYNLIYTEKNWSKALEILKIWKIRTPLLSAGVEGTLILLEALSINSNLSNYEQTHIFSAALIRFLNVCATNSDKQGTFFKLAMENDLPKWLIRIRHEIAHSNKVPSKQMLEISLKFCLDWIQVKYWHSQIENMSNLIVQESKNQELHDFIVAYVKMNSFFYFNPNSTSKKMKYFIKKLIVNPNVSYEEALDYFWINLKKLLITDLQSSSTLICDLLIYKHILLVEELENGKIKTSYLKIWNNLLDLMNETGILTKLVQELFSFTGNEQFTLELRYIGSLWLREIFQGFLCLKKGNKCKENLQFQFIGNIIENRQFIEDILNYPHLYTLNFLKEVLECFDVPEQFIENAILTVKAFTVVESTNNCDSPEMDKLHLLLNYEEPVEISTNQNEKWKIIKDASVYKNCPLSILPHQSRNANPIFNHDP